MCNINGDEVERRHSRSPADCTQQHTTPMMDSVITTPTNEFHFYIRDTASPCAATKTQLTHCQVSAVPEKTAAHYCVVVPTQTEEDASVN